MAKIAVRIAKGLRLVFGRLRLIGWQLLLGPKAVPWSADISSRVRLAVTDGGVLTLGERAVMDHDATIVVQRGVCEIGPDSYIGKGAVIVARESIRIGRHALIAEYVTIRDQDHNYGPGLITAQADFKTAAITIGDNVWIGAKATVTKGVTIGDNAVVGANSVVTRDVPANTVVAGAPARVVRRIGADQRPSKSR